MTQAIPPVVHKTVVALVGLGGALVGFFAGFLLAVIVGFGCGGSDASQPSESSLCQGNRDDAIVLGGWALATGGPLFGMAASLGTSRWRPLLTGMAVGLAGLVLLGLLVAWI